MLMQRAYGRMASQFGMKQSARFLLRGPSFWREVADFDRDDFLADQIARFNELGLDWRLAQDIISQVESGAERRDESEHYSLFAAWLSSRPSAHVLEVGTETGQFANFLSALVPQGLVVTLDLPVDNPRYRNATISEIHSPSDRGSLPPERSVFLGRPNIRFVEMNSLGLANSTKRFDAIWLDGDHTNPVVTMDIAQVVRLVNVGGLLAMDDIRFSGSWRGVQGSDEALKAIDALKAARIVDYVLIHKRVTEQHLLLPERRKFIAVVTRLTDRDPLQY